MIDEPESPHSHDAPEQAEPSGAITPEGIETDRHTGITWCTNCEDEVEPRIKNHCPKCGGWVLNNDGALIHGLRRAALPAEHKSRRDEIVRTLLAEFGNSASTIELGTICDYALTSVMCDQLDAHLASVGPLTQQGRGREAMNRFLAVSARKERLAATIAGYRAKRIADGTAPTNDADIVVRIERVIVDPAEDGTPRPVLSYEQTAQPASIAPTPIVNTTDVAKQQPQTKEDRCNYCNAPECKAEPLRSALHLNDPEEIKRRDEHATAVMLSQVGRS